MPTSSLEKQPGQLLLCGFQSTNVPGDLADLIRAGRVGGVILFARNIEGPAQTRELCNALHACAPSDAPLMIAVDQEGGRVQRLRAPWTEWPPMRKVAAASGFDGSTGSAGSKESETVATEAVATALARELFDLGITLDFAPVVDVDTNPANPVIGDRSFARSPDLVGRHAAAFIHAMQRSGVAACAKHFPGHGDTATDSHVELPRLEHTLERLRRIELPPFRASVRAGVASIMTAHILFPALDLERPATASRTVMDLLRKELGYDGVVFSDDLEMKAVADHYTPEVVVPACLDAGVDAMLVCSDAALRDRVLALLEATPSTQLERSLARVAALKRRFPARTRTPGGPPYPEHIALAARLTGDEDPADDSTA